MQSCDAEEGEVEFGVDLHVHPHRFRLWALWHRRPLRAIVEQKRAA